MSVSGAGTVTHTVKTDAVPAAAATEINNAIAAGNLVQLVFRDSGGTIIGVFAGQGVGGSASDTTTFVLTADGATNTCDVGSTGSDGDGTWASVEVKVIQS